MTLNDAIAAIRASAEASDAPLYITLQRCPDVIFRRMDDTENVWKLSIQAADELGYPLRPESIPDPVTS